MRSMLISLILFCSLTQFAIADPPPDQPLPAKFKPDVLKKCGDRLIFDCYAPKRCIDDTLKKAPLSDGGVVKITEHSEIFIDCEALIRFYQYGEHRVYVSFESFQKDTIIKKIEFIQKNDITNYVRTKFSCEIVDGKYVGKFFDVAKRAEENPRNHSSKLNCIFETKQRKSDLSVSIFEGTKQDRLQFLIDGVGTKNDEPFYDNINNARCDPSKIKFENVQINTTRYAKLNTKDPGNYFCDKDIYNMEFKSEGQENYQVIKKSDLKCVGQKFVIQNHEFRPNETLKIRCAAEAHYFCDYKVKATGNPNEPAPVLTKSDWPTKSASKLTCPSNKPHLIIVEESGKKKKIEKPTFKCINADGSGSWTVETNEGDILHLTPNSPKVYCTETLECKDFHEIRGSQVKDGEVNENTLEPTCHDSTLLVKVEGKPDQRVMNITCNTKLGKFEYIVGNEKHFIEKNTKFECLFPEDPGLKISDAQAKTLLEGSVAVIIIAATLAVAALGGITYVGYRQAKKDKERRRLVQLGNKAAWERYCRDEDEEEWYNNEGGHEKSAKAPEEPYNWSAMLMSFQHNSLRHIKKEEDNEWKFAFVNRENDKFAFNKTDENSKKCAVILRPGYITDVSRDTPEFIIQTKINQTLMWGAWDEEFEKNPKRRIRENIIGI